MVCLVRWLLKLVELFYLRVVVDVRFLHFGRNKGEGEKTLFSFNLISSLVEISLPSTPYVERCRDNSLDFVDKTISIIYVSS